jgi:pyrroline-5-carboxylate reductase
LDLLAAGMKRMVCGATRTLLESGLSPAEVMDRIQVKPFGADEPIIDKLYRVQLPALYEKIRP